MGRGEEMVRGERGEGRGGEVVGSSSAGSNLFFPSHFSPHPSLTTSVLSNLFECRVQLVCYLNILFV